MAWLVLCKEDGLWAMLPERSGGDTYGLRRLDAASANSAEALAAVAAVASGSACVVDLQRYEAAAACLSRDELVQAVTGAALLGSGGRSLPGLLPALQQCGEVVGGVPALPAAVLVNSSTAFGSAGSSGGSSGGTASGDSSDPCAPIVFELMHLLSKHSAVAPAAGGPPIQFDAAHEERQLRQRLQQLPYPDLPQPAAALAAGGSELWVRWADSASDWCLFRQAPGERPCVCCSCGYAGFGLLFCEHLAAAYRLFAAPPNTAGGSGGSSSGSSGAAPSGPVPVALDVTVLEAACAELTREQLRKLLLCTALYMGAGSVLLDGLGLKPADLQPLGGAGLAPEVAKYLLASKPSAEQMLQASGVHIGPYARPTYKPLKDPVPGCSLGSWRAACPAAAGPVACGTVPLLQHAALQLPPPTAEGLWLALGLATGNSGLPLIGPHQPQQTDLQPSGQRLLQAAQLLIDAGHWDSGRHLLQEWVVSLSLPAAWPPGRADDWREGLMQLWRQCMPAAACVEWWMGQVAVPGSSGAWPSRPRQQQQERQQEQEQERQQEPPPPPQQQQQQRLSAICSAEFILLVETLVGPLAAAQLTAALLDGLCLSSSRGAARAATFQTSLALSITDLTRPVGQAATWLSTAEAAGVGAACIRDQLLRGLQVVLTAKAPQHAEPQQAERPAARGGGRRARRRGQQGSAASGRGAAGSQTGQGPQLPPRSVGEAPTLLLSAARGMAGRLLALPLDEAMRLFDGLVPDLEPIVLGEMAALQAQQLSELQKDLKALMTRAQQALPSRQAAADGQASAAAAGGPSAAVGTAAAAGQQAQQAQQQQQQAQQQGQQQAQQQGQQQQAPLRLLDLHPNQQDSAIDQLINIFPPDAQAQYRRASRGVLLGSPVFQALYEQHRGQLRIPAPAGPGAAAAAQQAQQGRGLLDLLEAAAAPQPASSKRRLTYAACVCAEMLCRKHGWAAMRQLELENGAGWRHLITLLEQAQPQYSRWSADLLPAVLAAVCYLFTEAKHTPSKSQQRRQRQGAGGAAQQQGPAKVPAEVVAQLVSLLPGLLKTCCEAAAEALHGSGSSGGSGTASAAADPQPPGSPVVAAPPASRSVIADRDALALALSGIHSCLKLAEELYTADWPSCLSMHHTATLSRLRRLMPCALVRATAVLLELAVAADQAAAEVFIGLYMTVQHYWAVETERAASALLPLLPWTVPDAADASRPGTSAAAAAAAGESATSLLSLLPQVLAAAAALQRVRFSSPVRRNSLAMVCRCLQAAAVSQSTPAAERQQAAEALLRLVLSPAFAGELDVPDLKHPDTQQLMECALGAAAVVLQGGASDAGLGGELAYLAVNLLAHAASFTGVPLLTGEVAAGGASAARGKPAAEAAQNSAWQMTALQVIEWWQGSGQQQAGSPPPLFVASTLMSLLLRDWQPSVQSQATAALRRLAAADPLLLLHCDSLPQLVRLALRQAFRAHGPRELQEAVDALLMSVRQAATAAGRAEQHLWPVWQHHAPTAGPASQLTKTLDFLASAAAAGGLPVTQTDLWDRLAGRMAVLQAVGRRGSSGGGGGAGGHAWARAAAASAGVPGGPYPPGMSATKAAALRDATMRSAAAELMGYGLYKRTDMYGDSYTEDEDYLYDDDYGYDSLEEGIHFW